MKSLFAYRAHLDGLRAIAVFLVLLVHASYGHVSGGFLGVDLFFVLSGFLITGLLIEERAREGSIDLTAFYVRRAYRILPPLLTCLLLAALLWPHNMSSFPGAAIRSLFFIANFSNADVMQSLIHTWSLSIEEQFYLVWPLLVTSFLWTKSRVLTAIAVMIILLALVVRYTMLALGLEDQIYTFTFARMDSIMLGCLLALTRAKWTPVLEKRNSETINVISIVAMICLLSAGLFASKTFMENWFPAFTLFALTVSILIACLECSGGMRLKDLLSHPVAVFFGKRSYGLYLYHYPIFIYLDQWRTPGVLNFLVVVAVKIFVSLAITEASYRWIERPMLKRKSQWSIRRLRRPSVFAGISVEETAAQPVFKSDRVK